METISGNVGLIIDIVCLVILAAFIISNSIKGFFKQIFKIAVTIGSFLIAYFFCDNISALLEDKFNLLTKLSGKLVETFNISTTVQGTIQETIQSIVESMNLPQFIAEAALNSLNSVGLSVENSIDAAAKHIATTLSSYVLIGASFVGLLIISKLLLSIVAIILGKIVELPIINGIDKILGAVMGLLGGYLALTVLTYLMSILPGSLFNSIRESNSFIYSFLHKYNLLEAIISAVVAKF